MLDLLNFLHKSLDKIFADEIKLKIDPLSSKNNLLLSPIAVGIFMMISLSPMSLFIQVPTLNISSYSHQGEAFLTFSWSDIFETLSKMYLSSVFVQWTMTFVSSSRFVCLIDGNSSNWFQNNRKIRQGNLLSPYPFILIHHVLSNILNNFVRHKKIIPFNLKGIKISLLMYGDDLLITIRCNSKSCLDVC
ncbi:unnamed protein product [Musa textilis]